MPFIIRIPMRSNKSRYVMIFINNIRLLRTHIFIFIFNARNQQTKGTSITLWSMIINIAPSIVIGFKNISMFLLISPFRVCSPFCKKKRTDCKLQLSSSVNVDKLQPFPSSMSTYNLNAGFRNPYLHFTTATISP